MSETPKFKSGVGGSRGLANLLRQHSSNPNSISGFVSTDDSEGSPRPLPFSSPSFRQVVEDASKMKGVGREISYTPGEGRSLTPPPPPRKPVDVSNVMLSQSKTVESPRTESTTSISPKNAVTSPSNTSQATTTSEQVESTVIKNASFDKPLPPTASKSSRQATQPVLIEHVPLNELSISSPSPKQVAVEAPTSPPPPKPAMPPPPAVPPKPMAPPVQAVEEPAKPVKPEKPSSAPKPAPPAPLTSMPSNKTPGKGNVAIGAKAGGVYAEASYVGDGDEVDDSEW
jgi:hypothetical protein